MQGWNRNFILGAKASMRAKIGPCTFGLYQISLWVFKNVELVLKLSDSVKLIILSVYINEPFATFKISQVIESYRTTCIISA